MKYYIFEINLFIAIFREAAKHSFAKQLTITKNIFIFSI
jgi:hypothetical protein